MQIAISRTSQERFSKEISLWPVEKNHFTFDSLEKDFLDFSETNFCWWFAESLAWQILHAYFGDISEILYFSLVQSTLDKALFFYCQDNKLILAVGAHVDDLIGTGKPGEADKVLKKLRDIFDFGTWADDGEDKILEYGGKQITRQNGVIKLAQTKFILTGKSIALS